MCVAERERVVRRGEREVVAESVVAVSERVPAVTKSERGSVVAESVVAEGERVSAVAENERVSVVTDSERGCRRGEQTRFFVAESERVVRHGE